MLMLTGSPKVTLPATLESAAKYAKVTPTAMLAINITDSTIIAINDNVKSKNRLKTGAKIGSVALSLAGYGEAATATRIATNVADVGSQYFLMKPWGRDQELEADKLGMMIIHMAGYDITGVPDFV